MSMRLLLQAKPDVGPIITKTVVAAVSKAGDEAALASEIGALLNYVQYRLLTLNVAKQRKQWDVDREAKVAAAISEAMKKWDDQHYPRLLEATWGWHPFYRAFVANPVCYNFRPAFPLYHSIVEGLHVHSMLLQQTQVDRIYPVPWSVLLLRCFLKFHSLLYPVISHPVSGGSVSNVTRWLQHAEDPNADGWRSWNLAFRYLKEEGSLVFAGARPVDSRQQWLAELDVARGELKNPSQAWWAEFRVWCQSTQFRAVQDMAFHDKPAWLNAWVIRDQAASSLETLACYERWLQHREDIDIGYVLASPGIFRHLLFCLMLRVELTFALASS